MGLIVNFYQNFSLIEKLIYNLSLFVSYGIGYATLLPNFWWNGFSFTKPYFNQNQVESFKESDDEIVFRAKAAKGQITRGFKHFRSIPEIIKFYSEKYGDKPYLGTRSIVRKIEKFDEKTNKNMISMELGDYVWKSYKQVYQIIEYLSAGLLDIGLGALSEDKIIIFCDTREEWLITAVAAMLINVQIVTVYSALDDDAIVYAMNIVEAKYIMVDEKALGRVKKLQLKLQFVQKIIVCSNKSIDSLSDETSIELVSYDKLVSIGKDKFTFSSSFPSTPFITMSNEDDIAMIMFTSGSTGDPKGVIIKQKNILTQIGSVVYNEKYWNGITYCAFLPLAHMLELSAEVGVTSFGGKIGYCSPLTLTDNSPMIIPGTKGDLTVLKPTVGIFVPLLISRLSKAIVNHVKTQSRIKKFIFQWAYVYKSHFIQMGYDTPLLDRILFDKVRKVLGGKLRFLLSGGALLPLDHEIFCKVVFCARAYQGYGLTETCSSGALFNFDYPVFGSIGAPNTSVELKFRSWEEGRYSPLDKPNPRGEILLHGESITDGYYKQPELTQEAYIKDPKTNKTWFCTGDIGEMLPNGTLVLIDRKKDIIKLKHGEYIPLTKVEQAICNSKFVDMCAVAPSIQASYLIAIIVPNREQINKMLTELNVDLTLYRVFNEIIELKSVKDKIVQDIKSGITKSLNKFEMPAFFHIVTELWTPESNLVSPTLKLRRTEISSFYKKFLLED